ncbi:hypothetical protein [Cellulomonas sp. A375-1]|uniref:phosphoribosyltransferase-like protein n=1 Tax=Cellulomonas sp. A375-1 TaxID=1672219 RepID=UPI0012E1C46A|nr:hypothetical protein [Cellulomonas sp. A375-1]
MSAEQVLQARKYFSDTYIWPAQPAGIRPEIWLRNFEPAEQEHAIALLKAFVYFNKQFSEQLLKSSVKAVAKTLSAPGDSYALQKEMWRRYRQNFVLTYPTGEDPNPTDSGQMYSRWSRQLLGIDEDQILEPSAALERALRWGADVLFVDDFAGSGQQFIDTWKREVSIGTETASFASLAGRGYTGRLHYCPSICTTYALGRIQPVAPNVRVCASHYLPPEASLVHPRSLYIEPRLASDMSDLLIEVTRRSGLRFCAVGPHGFHNLGLGVAFEHSVPDATLPVFWHSSDDWKPLRRRR